MLKYIFFILMTTMFSANAYSASCYTITEAEAEQGIRIQSELMVIGLNCLHKDSQLYAKYRSLADNNSQLFEAYNQIMINHFKKNGIGNAEKEINVMRTTYANRISEIAAELRPDIFCSKYAPRIERAQSMNNSDIRKWASTFFASHPVSKPICES